MSSSLNPILFLVGILGLAVVLNAVRMFIRRSPGYTLLKLLGHVIVALTISLCAFYPQIAKDVTRILGFGENLNTLIFVGFITLFLTQYAQAKTIEKLDKKITEIAQKVALHRS